MPTSEAKIQANSQHTTSPRTLEAKAISRQNARKHGLTGEVIALSTEDAAEVESRFVSLRDELQPSTELGRLLIQRVALHSVRMDRCALQETAALSQRVRQAEADFVAPEGIDDDEADKLRAEAGAIALFDPSKEASLARRYEATAERGFYRALKEFRQIEREAQLTSQLPEPAKPYQQLGSFFPIEKSLEMVESLAKQGPPKTTQNPSPTQIKPATTSYEVPFSIGRSR